MNDKVDGGEVATIDEQNHSKYKNDV